MRKNEHNSLIITNETVEGESIRLGLNEFGDQIRNNVFRNCQFTIKRNRLVYFHNCAFYDCTFYFPKMKEIFDINNYFENCKFSGILEGYMGLKENHGIDGIDWGTPRIINCDFTKTILLGVGFLKIDVATTILPTWPNFSFIYPNDHIMDFRNVGIPKMPPLFATPVASPCPEILIYSYHWPSVIKWYKIKDPPPDDVIYSALKKLDYVYT